MKVQLLQRQPHPGQFSVEGYFSRVVDALLVLGIDAELSIAPVHSKGLLPRLQILDLQGFEVRLPISPATFTSRPLH